MFAASTPPFDVTPGILVGLAASRSLSSRSRRDGDPAARVRRGVRLRFGLGANLVALRFVPEVIGALHAAPGARRVARARPPRPRRRRSLGGGRRARASSRRGDARWRSRRRCSRSRSASTSRRSCRGLSVDAGGRARALAGAPPDRGASSASAARASSLALAARPRRACAGSLPEHARRARVGRRSRCRSPSSRVLARRTARCACAASSASATPAPHARVALVQPGFDAIDRWDASRAPMMIERLTTLTKSAGAARSRAHGLAGVGVPVHAPARGAHEPATARARSSRAACTGRSSRARTCHGAHGLGYNSAILAIADGTLSAPYDKRHLLWFGETVPLAALVPVAPQGLREGHRPRRRARERRARRRARSARRS